MDPTKWEEKADDQREAVKAGGQAGRCDKSPESKGKENAQKTLSHDHTVPHHLCCLQLGLPVQNWTTQLRSMIISFYEDMKGTVLYDSSMSEPFPIKSGVKQGCVLAPTLFGTFFSVLLSYAFSSSTEGIYTHTRSDGSLFSTAPIRTKTKTREVLVREMLFADDAALAAHTEEALQQMINSFSHACEEFGLTISLKKTNVSVQDASKVPCIKIGDYTLEVVEDFTYLGSTISSNLSLDKEINKRIGKASATMAKLSSRVWENKMLTMNTKARIYHACVHSILLYGSETWTTYMCQERCINTFHMCCLKQCSCTSFSTICMKTTICTFAYIPLYMG